MYTISPLIMLEYCDGLIDVKWEFVYNYKLKE